MKRAAGRSLQLFTLIAFVWVSFTSGQVPQPAGIGTIEELQVPAPSLAGNLIGDPAIQGVHVYLPPGYKRDTTRRYPTLYSLHGYTGSPESWLRDPDVGMNLPASMDQLIAKGAAAEMIVIAPNGRNAFLGGFYTNSPVTGNWEDYIYRDVVKFIDERYRTIAKPASRGIVGHSMGGYGAFMLAMKHPDVFGAVYALSPCCLGLEGDLSGDNPIWAKAAKVTSRDLFSRGSGSFDEFMTGALIALSAAFTPNRARSPLHPDLPFIDKNGSLVRNEPVHSKFRAKMPLYVIEQHRDNLIKLRGISVDVGQYDEFTHIKRTTPMLSAELSKFGIPHSFEIFAGGDHQNKVKERFSTKVVPFFTALLEK
jgi:S-formylglutathione hydrolase